MSTKSIESLVRLLRIAKQKTQELSLRISDLETACASAVTSLEWLEQAVLSEERQKDVNYADLARYMEGASAKQRGLQATYKTLRDESEAAKSELAEAFSEMKKLEHLISVARKADKRHRGKKTEAETNELAIARRAS